ncbi:hypothetical protein Tco_1200970 [Tanacetum coccineum]
MGYKTSSQTHPFWWWRRDCDMEVEMVVGSGDGVVESEYGDRVDPVVRTTFGVRRKIPPEKFSGGGGRNPVGESGRRWGGMRGERERELKKMYVYMLR